MKMTIDKAIEKATAGGYPKAGNFTAKYEITRYPSILLDPRFWQSFSKTIGLVDKCEAEQSPRRHMWKYYWHSFIDHLAEGKTLESFFETFS